jgi:DNA-binding response OmpR family regulator
MPRIMIVEDEARIASFLEEGLQGEGFATFVAGDGDRAIEISHDLEIDAVVLDIMLPKRDGYDVLTELRKRRPALPVLVLTARDDLNSKVVGLNAGADDYLTKPFAFEELLARLRALLRRSGQAPVLSVGALTLDLRMRTVRVGDASVELSDREFALLEYLVRHPNETLTRQEILAQVWQLNFDPQSTVLETTMNRLRRKLTFAGAVPPIETVRGAGYRFVAGNEPT